MGGALGIDEVVSRMKSVAGELAAADDARLAFHATYLRTTEAVAQALRAGAFGDPDWVERWDVAFAELYLDALEASRTGGPVPRPWEVAFGTAATKPKFPPLRHILLGMNAHINYDLPQALLAVITDAEFADPVLTERREADHRRIDEVLAARVRAEDSQLRRLETSRSWQDQVLQPLNRAATRRFLREARDKVWANALLLSRARHNGGEEYTQRLAELERLSGDRVADLVRPGPVLLRLAAGGFGVCLPAATGLLATGRHTTGGHTGGPGAAGARGDGTQARGGRAGEVTRQAGHAMRGAAGATRPVSRIGGLAGGGGPSRLRTFDPVAVGRLECAMWAAYYRREWARLLVLSVRVTRVAFGLDRGRALHGAWLVLRANQLWAPGKGDPDGARRYMRRFYALLRLAYGEPADPAGAARLEVAWWAIHRERQAGDSQASEPLVTALTRLYAFLYRADEAAVRPAAEQRAQAMDICDRWVAEGCALDSPLLAAERAALVRSYAALLAAVHR
jgi:uncharacterized protein DUF5995